MKWVSKKEEFFLSQYENGTYNVFMLNWNGFAAKTKNENVLEIFWGLQVGFRFFCPGSAKWRENFD